MRERERWYCRESGFFSVAISDSKVAFSQLLLVAVKCTEMRGMW